MYIYIYTCMYIDVFTCVFISSSSSLLSTLKIAIKQEVGGSTVTGQTLTKLTNIQGDKGVLN